MLEDGLRGRFVRWGGVLGGAASGSGVTTGVHMGFFIFRTSWPPWLPLGYRLYDFLCVDLVVNFGHILFTPFYNKGGNKNMSYKKLPIGQMDVTIQL